MQVLQHLRPHFGAFELGNEPALWRSNGWTNTTAAQHAADFATLRRLLYMQSGYAPAPKILGPDVFVQCLPSGCDTSYVRAFLAATPDLDAFTFHTYPWLGTVKAPATTPDAATLLNKSWLDIAGAARIRTISSSSKQRREACFGILCDRGCWCHGRQEL